MKAVAILLLCASVLAAAEVPANFAPGRDIIHFVTRASTPPTIQRTGASFIAREIALVAIQRSLMTPSGMAL